MNHYKAPDNSLHVIEPEFAYMLPAGCVEITEAEAEAIRAAKVPPAPIPQSVTRFQARAALLNAGLLDQVNTMMADPATPAIAKLAWTDAQEFRRTSPTVQAMGAVLGLTDQQLDDLFVAASVIEA